MAETKKNMIINSIEISLRKQTTIIDLFAGCGGLNVSDIIAKDCKQAVSEYKRLSKSHNPKLWEENKDELMAMKEVVMPMWQNWNLEIVYPNKVKRIATNVNLDKHHQIGKTEIARRIVSYFRGQNIPVGRGFTGDPEIWVPSSKKPEYNGKYYEKFAIRPRYQDQSAGWELHITHSGTALVGNLPKSELSDLPERGYRVVVNNEVVSMSNLSPRHRKNQHAMFPVANRLLERIIRLKPHYGYNTDKLAYKRRLIDGFLNSYILQDNFRDSVGIDFPSGKWMNVHEEEIKHVLDDARLLEYSDGNTGVNPMNDLPTHGPYRCPDKPVKFIMIFQSDPGRGQYKAAMKLLNGLTYGVESDEDIRVKSTDSEEEYQSKVAKQSTRSFRSMSQFIGQPFSIPEGNGFFFKTLDEAVSDVRQHLDRFKQSPEYTYEAVYISPIKRDDAGSDAELVYFKLKEMLMERGIMLQTIYSQNPYQRNFKYFIPNLSLAMFAKAGGVPFVLHKPYGQNDLIIGVGAYCNKKVGKRYVGSAICFDNRGMLQGYNCWPDSDTDRLKNSMKKGIMSFIENNGCVPNRVIIHYYKTMSQREARPITTMLYNLGLKNVPVYVITINKTESEDLIGFDETETNLMPVSGTVINIGRGNYLLYNNTRYNQHDQAEVLYPIKLRLSRVDENGKSQAYSDDEAMELITQVYQFSRLSYKTVKQQNMPITTLYPVLAAQIVPFFDGKCIPENGRKYPGFL